MFNIVVDSLADGPPHIFRDVPIASALVYWRDKEFKDKKDIDVFKAIEMAEKGSVKTAGAPVSEFIKAVRQLPRDVPVLIITASSGISGTYRNALVASRMLERQGYKVYVLDSRSGSIGEGLVLEEAQRLRSEDIEDALQRLEKFVERVSLYLTVDDVRFLAKSGRIPKLLGFIGGAIGLRPIIGVVDGRLEPVAKVIGRKKAMEWMAERAKKGKRMVIGAVGKDREILEEFGKILGMVDWESDVSPAITVYVGPKAFGVAFYQ